MIGMMMSHAARQAVAMRVWKLHEVIEECPGLHLCEIWRETGTSESIEIRVPMDMAYRDEIWTGDTLTGCEIESRRAEADGLGSNELTRMRIRNMKVKPDDLRRRVWTKFGGTWFYLRNLDLRPLEAR